MVVMACVDCNSKSGYHGILPTNQPRKEGRKEGRHKPNSFAYEDESKSKVNFL